MSAETITVDGRDYVLLPHFADWSKEPQSTRIWETVVTEGLTGAEERARVRPYPRVRMTWMTTTDNEREEARLEARFRAAKRSGYAAAPWFGRGMNVVTATSGASTVTVDDTPWLPQGGDWIIVMARSDDSEPVYNAREVLSVLGNVLTISGTLSATWPAESWVYPVIAGEFQGSTRQSVIGEVGSWSMSIDTPTKPPPGGGVQVDGFQSVLGSVENYTDKWGPYVQMDGYQSVLASIKTATEIPDWGNHVQVDGYQAVVLVLES